MPVTDDLLRRLTAAAASVHRIPALSVAVADRHGAYRTASVGYADLASRRPATPDDQYLWFSMSKIATATTAMRLAVAGRLDLDAPVDTYLRAPSARRTPAPTTRQLLTHTAGLGNPVPVRWVRPAAAREDPARLDRVLARHGSPRRSPPAPARYSNLGYLLAGRVIEAVTGQAVTAAVEDVVLRPLGMTETGYAYSPDRPRAVGYVRSPRALMPLLRAALPRGLVDGHVEGRAALAPFLVDGPAYGGLVGTARDALKLAAAHLPDGTAPDPLLPAEALREMRTIAHPGKPFDHGIGWFRRPEDTSRVPAFVEHYGTGGGFWNALRIYPDLGIAMVAMANTTSRWDVDALFSDVATHTRSS